MSADQLIKNFFSINDRRSFADVALSVFRYQAQQNDVYKEYLSLLNINIENISRIDQIPFLPIQFFKTHIVVSGNKKAEEIFLSSGTTGTTPSRHFVSDLSIYEKSFTNGFKLFYGDPKQYAFLALLPSYLQRNGSSLVYMANKLIALSEHSHSGFYLNNIEELLSKITMLEKSRQKYIVLGVTYALLELAEEVIKKKLSSLKYGILMETGGMKGMRKEMVRDEIHSLLKNAFGLTEIHSEYGMTELLSQAYSNGNGLFSCPPWMQVLISDTNDPFKIIDTGKTGGINIIDLANINSCSFIATQDLGKLHNDNRFEVLGRFNNAELRGCNLLIN